MFVSYVYWFYYSHVFRRHQRIDLTGGMPCYSRISTGRYSFLGFHRYYHSLLDKGPTNTILPSPFSFFRDTSKVNKWSLNKYLS